MFPANLSIVDPKKNKNTDLSVSRSLQPALSFCVKSKLDLLFIPPKSSRMLTESNTGKPTTPRRIKPMQALSGLFRTPTRLHTPTTLSNPNKRVRSCASLSSPTPSTPDIPSLPPVVLQTYSVSTDSIVLTALPSAPFCCHEDLLTMSRAQLEGVVRVLNTRLPNQMRIRPEDDFWQDGSVECDDEGDVLSRMSEAEMRRCIEELVGIRTVVGKNRVSRIGLGGAARGRVPSAPKAVRTRNVAWRPFAKTPWEMEVDDAQDQADELSNMLDETLIGSSPLASRTKTGAHMRRKSGAMSRLPILQEESEGNEAGVDVSERDEGRPSKRQRMSPADVTRYAQEGFCVIQEARESRLIENMDVSGSPLLAREDDTSAGGFSDSDGKVLTTTGSLVIDATTSEDAPAPPQYRRSARIKEISLKRASSGDTGQKATCDGKSLKSTILRSRTFSSRRSPGPNASTGSNLPRETATCLPFLSTSSHQKLESPVWSAPRVLRSHSQRLLNPNKPTERKTLLGRSRSERYSRPADLAFVTIDRPRYRFPRCKPDRSELTEGSQESHLAVSPSRAGGQLQHGSQIGIEHSNGKSNYGVGNDGTNQVLEMCGRRIVTGSFPLALCNLLSPRSRAFSTSTVTSTQSSPDDSPVLERTSNMIPKDGTSEHVWEALGRMVVDSREIGSE